MLPAGFDGAASPRQQRSAEAASSAGQSPRRSADRPGRPPPEAAVLAAAQASRLRRSSAPSAPLQRPRRLCRSTPVPPSTTPGAQSAQLCLARFVVWARFYKPSIRRSYLHCRLLRQRAEDVFGPAAKFQGCDLVKAGENLHHLQSIHCADLRIICFLSVCKAPREMY